MGTIRNRVVIVHHYRKEEIEKIRQDAVDFFQKGVLEDNKFSKYKVNTKMVTPIMESLINGEYTFMIMGECSKIGWSSSNLFDKKRREWIENNRDKCQNIILVDFGEEYEAEMEAYQVAMNRRFQGRKI